MLDNVNIDRSNDGYENHKAALTVKGKGDTEIELDGDNILKGGEKHAGLEKNDSDGTGTLTIKDDNKAADGSKGSLLARVENTVPVLVVENARTPLISQSLAAKSQRSAGGVLPALAAVAVLMVQTLPSKEMPL